MNLKKPTTTKTNKNKECSFSVRPISCTLFSSFFHIIIFVVFCRGHYITQVFVDFCREHWSITAGEYSGECCGWIAGRSCGWQSWLGAGACSELWIGAADCCCQSCAVDSFVCSFSYGSPLFAKISFSYSFAVLGAQGLAGVFPPVSFYCPLQKETGGDILSLFDGWMDTVSAFQPVSLSRNSGKNTHHCVRRRAAHAALRIAKASCKTLPKENLAACSLTASRTPI